jgi:hypothetical protein
VIDNNDDIKWVASQRPPVVPPDSETTKRVRAGLLAHTENSTHLVAVSQPSALASKRRFTGFLKGHRRLSAAAAVAIMATAAAVTLIVGIPGTSDHGLVIGVPPAQAQPLLALASRVLAAPARTGNATLVLHTNAFSDGTSFTGADLHLDDGRYYYAQTAAGLPESAKGGPIDYDLKSAIDVAASVAHSDPEVARAAFLKAITPLYAGDSLSTRSRAIQDNRIWVTAIDALGAAYGRPDVLAGILNVLATVNGMTVESGVYNGKSVLNVSLTTPAHPYVAPSVDKNADPAMRQKLEQAARLAATHPTVAQDVQTLTLDDQTGAVLLYTDKGGQTSQETPNDLTETYHVSRVNAADYGL